MAKKNENLKNRMVVKVTNDPRRYDTGETELQCYRPGVPRANYMPYPFQVLQTPEQILIVYEYKSAVRTIYMNSKEDPPSDTWMGWSKGRWEGDTLVVDVTGFESYTWFDRAGNFHSDALHVVERYTPVSPYHLQYEATIEDPKVFTDRGNTPIYRRVSRCHSRIQLRPFVEEMSTGPLAYKPARSGDVGAGGSDDVIERRANGVVTLRCRSVRSAGRSQAAQSERTFDRRQSDTWRQSGGEGRTGRRLDEGGTPHGRPGRSGLAGLLSITAAIRPGTFRFSWRQGGLQEEEALAAFSERSRPTRMDPRVFRRLERYGMERANGGVSEPSSR